MKFLSTLVIVGLTFAAFGELSIEIQTAEKAKIKSNEHIVTNIVVTGTASLDTNTVEGASVADIHIKDGDVTLKAKNPDLAGAENLKGMMLLRLGNDATMDKKNFANLPSTITINGEKFRIVPIMSARTVDAKLARRMPKWERSKAEALPQVTVTSTPEDLINGYNAIRDFLISNAVETVVSESAATVEDGPALIGGTPLDL